MNYYKLTPAQNVTVNDLIYRDCKIYQVKEIDVYVPHITIITDGRYGNEKHYYYLNELIPVAIDREHVIKETAARIWEAIKKECNITE